MAQRFFIIPVQSSETAEADLNAFLTSHKVLTVDRRWVDLGGGWSCRRVALVNTQCIQGTGFYSWSIKSSVLIAASSKIDRNVPFAISWFP